MHVHLQWVGDLVPSVLQLAVASMLVNLGNKDLDHLVTKPKEQCRLHGDIPESSRAAVVRGSGQSMSDDCKKILGTDVVTSSVDSKLNVKN